MIHFAHIGLPKTGSTFLQTEVFPKHPQLCVFGTHGEDKQVNEHSERLWRDEVGALDFEGWCSRWRDQFEHMRDGISIRDRMVGLSNERLSGHFITGHNAFAIADRLHRVFGSIRIVIVLRHPLSYLASAYNQFIKQGSAETLPWLLQDKINLPGDRLIFRLDYQRLLAYYRALFGEQNVLVLPQEMLKKERDEFLGHLFDFLGIDRIGVNAAACEKLTPANYGRTNPSYSRVALRLLRLANYLGVDLRTSRRWITRLERRGLRKIGGNTRTMQTERAVRDQPSLAGLLLSENYEIWTGKLSRYNYRF